jgi:hypothetical protein
MTMRNKQGSREVKTIKAWAVFDNSDRTYKEPQLDITSINLHGRENAIRQFLSDPTVEEDIDRWVDWVNMGYTVRPITIIYPTGAEDENIDYEPCLDCNGTGQLAGCLDEPCENCQNTGVIYK